MIWCEAISQPCRSVARRSTRIRSSGQRSIAEALRPLGLPEPIDQLRLVRALGKQRGQIVVADRERLLGAQLGLENRALAGQEDCAQHRVALHQRRQRPLQHIQIQRPIDI